MTIKQHGGVFGRNPTFNNVTVDGTLIVDQIVEKTSAAGITLDGVTLKEGNVVLGSGKGIDFSATSGTGTSKLFDDYEEGTWTPVNVQAGFNQTISGYSNAIYTKVGRLVRVSFTVNLAVSGRPTGWASFSGLPFTASNTQAGGTYNSSALAGGGRGANAYVGGAIVYLFAAPNTVDSTAWHISMPYST